MEAPIQRPNLLHLPGVTLKDFVPVEDLFDEKVLEQAASETLAPGEAPPLPYSKIPPLFTGVADWPTSTNLLCWSCSFSFDGPPRFIPKYIQENGQSEVVVGVQGNFCTFNCAGLYIDTHYPRAANPQKHFRLRENLSILYYLVTGCRVTHIPAAPPVTQLRKYGGDMTEDLFWKEMRRLDQEHGLRDHRPGTVVPERMRASGQRVWAQGVVESCPAVTAAAFPALGAAAAPRDAAASPGDAAAAAASPGDAAAASPGDAAAASPEDAAESAALAAALGLLSSAPPPPPGPPNPEGLGPA